MVQRVGDIAVRLGADVGPFRRGMDAAGRGMSRFERQGHSMGRTLVDASRATVVAITAIGAASVALTANAARAGSEIENLSRISLASTREFQRQAAAAQTVGVQADQLADTFRDVTDRIGDFMATGAGPMADFFENIAPRVGVTVDQFARLSGPEALQLYVSSLERANVSSAEMAFYLEAISSNSTNLLPLLQNNGQAMRELGDAAERAGRVLSQEAIANARELNTVLTTVSGTIRTSFNAAILENGDAVIDAAEDISERLIPAIQAIVPVVADAISQVSALVETLSTIGGAIQGILDLLPEGISFTPAGNVVNGLQLGVETFNEVIGNNSQAARRIRSQGAPAWGGLNSGYAAAAGDAFTGSFASPGASVFTPGVGPMTSGTGIVFRPGLLPPGLGESGGGGASGGGGGGNLRGRFEALRQTLLTEREIIAEEYEARLEQLREFRDAEAITDAEFNEQAARAAEEHAERLRQIDAQARAARLQEVSSLFGSMASIIESGGRRNLEIVRGLRVAEAVITGYQAAVDAWQRGMKVGGPPTAALFAAASVARTGALIAQMKSTGAGGGSGGGSSAGASSTAVTPRPTQNVVIDLVNASGAQVNQVQSLVDLLTEANRQGYDLNAIVKSS